MGRGKRVKDAKLLKGLAEGKTIKAAAEAASMSRMSAHRLLRTETFQQELKTVREDAGLTLPKIAEVVAAGIKKGRIGSQVEYIDRAKWFFPELKQEADKEANMTALPNFVAFIVQQREQRGL